MERQIIEWMGRLAVAGMIAWSIGRMSDCVETNHEHKWTACESALAHCRHGGDE